MKKFNFLWLYHIKVGYQNLDYVFLEINNFIHIILDTPIQVVFTHLLHKLLTMDINKKYC